MSDADCTPGREPRSVAASKENLNLIQWSAVKTVHMCVCVSLCTAAVHNAAQNNSHNLLSCYPPEDNHYCSDVVYWRRGRVIQRAQLTTWWRRSVIKKNYNVLLKAKFHYAILLASELVRELVCDLLASWSQTC